MTKFLRGTLVLGAVLSAIFACGGDSVPKLAWPRSAAIPLTRLAESYAAQVVIGQQTFSLIVDTGSSTTVIAGQSCSGCNEPPPRYSPGSTATDTGEETSGQYLDLSAWNAEIYSDQVGLGSGTPKVPLRIAAITVEMGFFGEHDSQGILGLGPPEALVGDTTDYVTVAGESSAPTQLSFELCSDGGTLWIGDYDADAGAMPPQFTPLRSGTDSEPHYNLTLSDVAIGSTSLASSAAFSHPIFDTGTTDFILPGQAYDALIAAVNQAPGTASLFGSQKLNASDTVPCLSSAGVTAAQVDAMLPAMTTSFPNGAGGTFTLRAPPTRSYLTDLGNGQFCLAVANGGDGADAQTVLGIAFLRGFLSVLDLPHQQIGFAPDRGCH